MKAMREFFTKFVGTPKTAGGSANGKASGNGQPDSPSGAKAAVAPTGTKDRDPTYDPFAKDDVELDDIDVTPLQATMAVGATQQFTATAVYADGSKKDVTSSIDWLVNDLAILSINEKGLATAMQAAGTVEVTAMDAETGLSSPSAKVTVTADGRADAPDAKPETGLIDPFAPGADKPSAPKKPGPGDPPPVLKTIMVTPAAKVSIAAGATLQFNALGLFAGGPDQDVTKKVDWSSSDQFHVAIDAKTGLATGKHGPGAVKITAKDPATGVSDAVDVTLPEPVLKGISIDVPQKVVGGGAFKLWPRVINSNGTQSETFSDVDIKAAPPNIVSIAGAPDDKGAWQITILKPGDVTFTVKDRASGLSGTAKTKIVPPGAGAEKVNVQIILTRFDDGTMFSGLDAFAYFKCPGAADVFVNGSVSAGALTFNDVTVMPAGRIELSVQGPDKDMLTTGAAPYKLSGKLLTFTAAQKAETGKTTAATAEQAAKKVGAIGTIGTNVRVENMGDVTCEEPGHTHGKSKEVAWEVTWGTEALIVKQA
ncbi:MAG: Ig-like domain-containing protein [Gemmataceae bacterium]|nr:Ig-like domain-containing protein [Gemmataceae bacterium]